MNTAAPFPTDGHEFGLCLTHDVDRPYKTIQSLFYAATERDLGHLQSLRPDENPWWQFEEIMDLESSFGVRSAFYFLSEQHLFKERSPDDWTDVRNWIEHVSRYDPRSEEIATIIRRLDEEGWEVGLHGSLGTQTNPERLAAEKSIIEDILGHDIVGGRQHHLRLDIPESWKHHSQIGLSYDTSLGSSSRVGFQFGYYPIRPFDDEFVVFPLTVMDTALVEITDSIAAARQQLYDLLETAKAENAVMTALWHPRNFSRSDYPGHRDLYRDLLARALEMGAWVGSPAQLYDQLEQDTTESRRVEATTTTE